jgi:hypothetical protein
MSWNRAHRRHHLVHLVLSAISDTGRPEIPAGLRPEVDAEFGGLEGFLREVQSRWYRTFDARLDALVECWPDDVHHALHELWREVSIAMPEARALLDAHVDHPALAALHRHHRRQLYAATGVHLDPLLTFRPPEPARRRSPRRSQRRSCALLFLARPSTT